MSDQELMNLIEDVEQNELHKAPDYLKETTLLKAEQAQKKEKLTKAEQLLYYKVRVFAAMAASLILLFSVPQPGPKLDEKNTVSIMQMFHEKSNELCRFLNQFSSGLVLREDF